MADPAENIFEEQAPVTSEKPKEEAPSNPEATSNDNSFDTLLQSIVTEDGRQKYTDVPSALQSIPHAQQHISRLEQESAQLKQKVDELQKELEKRTGVEEALRMSKQNEGQAAEPVDVEAVVEQYITKREAQRTAEQNVSTVIGKFKELYGDKAEAEFYSRAEKLGLGKGFVNSLAMQSPTAVFQVLGVTNAPTTNKPSLQTGSINTVGMNTNTTEELSAKVKGTSTKDLVSAWRAAAQKVQGV